MNTQPAPEADDLERRYPRWQVWQADSGAWWAAVRRNLTPAEERAGRRPFLTAGSGGDLEALLRQDEEAAR